MRMYIDSLDNLLYAYLGAGDREGRVDMRAKLAALGVALVVTALPVVAAFFAAPARAIVTDDVIVVVVFDDGTIVI